MGYYKALNQVEGNLYAGTHAGNYLEQAISNAKKSIWVICPYVGESYLKTLLQKQSEGVEVHALFHEIKNPQPQPSLQYPSARSYNYSAGGSMGRQQAEYDRFGFGNIISSLINVQRLILPQNIKEREKLKRKAKIYAGIAYAMTLLLFLVGAFALFNLEIVLQRLSSLSVTKPGFMYLLIQMIPAAFCAILILFSVSSNLTKKRGRLPTIQLKFSADVDFHLVRKEKDDFLHLKMFIIDDEVAFLGSLNLTYSGINRNLESCFSIRHKGTIQQLLELYQEVRSKVPSYSMQEIGEFYFGSYEYTEHIALNQKPGVTDGHA